ncbi:hypothetical protein HOO65_030958 [Ceratocystis lukuohia]|uniref:Uncharacterized protein n=1 Tax=Ceratocystis lukuohia TaxID=2019550 RepID=A0ABR4MME0_9PEZI
MRYFQDPLLVATIQDNKLDFELARQDRLSLPQVFHAVFHNKNLPCDQMQWVVMDIVDVATHLYVESYWIINRLNSEQVVKIKPNQLDWKVFFPAVYYEHATEIAPSAKADEVLIKEQQRDWIHSKYIAVIAEVMMMVSLKQPV